MLAVADNNVKMMREPVVNAMKSIVKKTMISYHEDFYKFDLSAIEYLLAEEIPVFIWYVDYASTHLIWNVFDSKDHADKLDFIYAIQSMKGKSRNGKWYIANLANGTLTFVTFEKLIQKCNVTF